MGEDTEIYRKKKRPSLEVSTQSLHSEIRESQGRARGIGGRGAEDTRIAQVRHQLNSAHGGAQNPAWVCDWSSTYLICCWLSLCAENERVGDPVTACFGHSFSPWVCPTD